MVYWIIIVILACVAGYDIYRAITKQKTLSQLYWPLLPWQVDFALMCVLVGLCWWLFSEKVASVLMVGCAMGHLLWHTNS